MADTLKYTDDLVVRYFITKNRRTPFAALYGQWQRGNFAKVCAAGHCLYQRAATPDEINAYANRPREPVGVNILFASSDHSQK